jgi:hypothetical protein
MTSTPAHPSPDAPTKHVALAEQVRRIARENELLAYSSAGDPKDVHASRRFAIRAGILHLAAKALAQSPPSTGVQPRPSREDVARDEAVKALIEAYRAWEAEEVDSGIYVLEAVGPALAALSRKANK